MGDILADNLKERMTTSQQINTNITSGNPTLVEHDKPTDLKVVDVNGTRGLEVSHTGQGVVQGINFSANGTVVIVPKSEGGADLNGIANITTGNGEKGTNGSV